MKRRDVRVENADLSTRATHVIESMLSARTAAFEPIFRDETLTWDEVMATRSSELRVHIERAARRLNTTPYRALLQVRNCGRTTAQEILAFTCIDRGL